MIAYDFTRQAYKLLLKLPPNIQRQIIKKLEHYLAQPDPLVFAKRIAGSPAESYRFQAGDYRIIFDRLDARRVLITKVGHRKDVYKN